MRTARSSNPASSPRRPVSIKPIGFAPGEVAGQADARQVEPVGELRQAQHLGVHREVGHPSSADRRFAAAGSARSGSGSRRHSASAASYRAAPFAYPAQRGDVVGGQHRGAEVDARADARVVRPMPPAIRSRCQSYASTAMTKPVARGHARFGQDRHLRSVISRTGRGQPLRTRPRRPASRRHPSDHRR